VKRIGFVPELLQRVQQRVGTVVRRKYRIDRLLGLGGTAAVFEATHRNGSRVALKVLHPEFARVEQIRSRFLREGYVANRIAHPGVTKVIDDDDDDEGDTVFLVLELLHGETLDRRSERLGGRIPLPETLWHADRVLDVLAAAHDGGIVHRDIKPENLFLTTEGELKVLDFGIARLVEETSATRSGQLLGTPAFMSPEQANGRVRDVDARSDLWSAGAVLFTLLTGSYVHPGSTGAEVLIYAATTPARPIGSLAPWLPPEVARIVDRALAFEQADRWSSAREMQARLRGVSLPAQPPAIQPLQEPAPPATQRIAVTVDDEARAGETLVHGFPARRKTNEE
jgi:serine/threonine-protein kinase